MYLAFRTQAWTLQSRLSGSEEKWKMERRKHFEKVMFTRQMMRKKEKRSLKEEQNKIEGLFERNNKRKTLFEKTNKEGGTY